jgi:hypothetical protein
MIEPKGWAYNGELAEWVNDDHAYPCTVYADVDGKFYAAVWVEYPGSWNPRTGGYPSEFDAVDVGTGFDSLEEARAAVLAEVCRLEDELAAGYAVLEGMEACDG